ncbi:MAG: DUF3368 domain-containing protein [Candidatus Njordarchaeum guaymaensis]
MCIVNATPLIYLVKVKRLELLFKMFNTVQIPYEVKVKVVNRGRKQGYSDAFLVEKAIKNGEIIVHKLKEAEILEAKRIADTFNIDLGEAQVIVLAKRKNEKIVIVDDLIARKAAEMNDLKPRGTLSILLESIRRKILSKEDCKKILDNLIDKGFRMGINIYKKFLEKL